MEPIIRFRASQIHARPTTSLIAQEILKLQREFTKKSLGWGLIIVLHKMLEIEDLHPENIDLTEKAVHYYGENYELPYELPILPPLPTP